MTDQEWFDFVESVLAEAGWTKTAHADPLARVAAVWDSPSRNAIHPFLVVPRPFMRTDNPEEYERYRRNVETVMGGSLGRAYWLGMAGSEEGE